MIDDDDNENFHLLSC